MKADCECPLYFSDKVFYTEFNRISCKAAFGYEQVAKRIANIRLTTVIDKNVSKLSNQRGEVEDRDFYRNSIKI